MFNTKVIIPKKSLKSSENVACQHKPYSKPALVELGDLRTLTLGGTNIDYTDSTYSELHPGGVVFQL